MSLKNNSKTKTPKRKTNTLDLFVVKNKVAKPAVSGNESEKCVPSCSVDELEKCFSPWSAISISNNCQDNSVCVSDGGNAGNKPDRGLNLYSNDEAATAGCSQVQVVSDLNAFPGDIRY